MHLHVRGSFLKLNTTALNNNLVYLRDMNSHSKKQKLMKCDIFNYVVSTACN